MQGSDRRAQLDDPAAFLRRPRGPLRATLATPDRRHDFSTWLRMLVEDMLVIDAVTIYPRYARSGAVYSLDVIDGATIKPLIGDDGRAPAAPDPAYQQAPHRTASPISPPTRSSICRATCARIGSTVSRRSSRSR
ncbi:MAG TPA: hypothetical protein VN715_04415 [Roseiarcus sp.]|nr:hypothetical protein [Roseiarcus sp.]